MMARKAKVISLRERMLEQIDTEIAAAKEHVSLANDLTDLLNLIPDDAPKVEKQGNVITGAFVKKDSE